MPKHKHEWQFWKEYNAQGVNDKDCWVVKNEVTFICHCGQTKTVKVKT